MAVTPGEARFTAEELVAVAAENSLRATTRLITDWVGLGLLDQPHHPGRGRPHGGSKPGTWSFLQAQLFVDLLFLRQRPNDPVRSIAGLTNVPVSGWLWGAEESGVPLRQVRRALATWCGRHRSRKSISATRARRIAREMLKGLDNPHASRAARRELVRVLETSIRESRFDAVKTRAAVARVFDPNAVGRSVGPAEVAATAGSSAWVLEAQATGFLQLSTFTDQEFEDARLIYRQGRREYAELVPRLSSNRQGSPLRFDDATLESVLNSACPNLLFTLGLGRLAPSRQRELAAEARDAEENDNAA